MKNGTGIRTAILLGTGLALAGGCSQKTEDVRIKLCRNVTERLLESMQPIEWRSHEAGVRKEGDAAVKLAFAVSRAGYENRTVTSACFFRRDLLEESALDHVDPLAAFATVPYAMTIEGKPVPDDVLKKAVKNEQVEPFIEFFDKAKKEFENLGK